VSDEGGYSGSEVTAIDDIEIYDYDEYLAIYGELPLGGIEEQDETEPDYGDYNDERDYDDDL
jgi:hypothetical protein